MSIAREFAPVFLPATSGRSMVVSLTTGDGESRFECAPVIGYRVDRTEYGTSKTTRAIIEDTQAIPLSDHSHLTTSECSSAGGCGVARQHATTDETGRR